MRVVILGIESSCDDTSAAVICDGVIGSNVIANQDVHRIYGGVVPELASRAHQQNIVPVVDTALKKAGITLDEVSAIAFTRGPGLLGSLLVGTSFAKGLAIARNLPLIDVNHLQAHVLALFIKQTIDDMHHPQFPFICLLVSGGNSQLIVVKSHLEMEVVGTTIDDAAGEAFDKCAKIMDLPYPGGPMIDKYAKNGNPKSIVLAKPRIEGYDYSFSGLKTSFLYHIRDMRKDHPDYIQQNLPNLCASLQFTIVDILMEKLRKLVKDTGIKQVAIAGGVSANSGLRQAMIDFGQEKNIKIFIPKFEYTTDNAAMIAITGYFKYLQNQFTHHDIAPLARFKI